MSYTWHGLLGKSYSTESFARNNTEERAESQIRNLQFLFLPMVSTLPVLVFFAETIVVTLSTVRTIFIARGWKVLAPLLGFFEVSIWLFAISQVIQNLTSPSCFVAFAGGFSLGNFLGVLIEQKLALGNVVVHITTREDAADLIEDLKIGGYGVTALDAQGATGPVQVIFTVIKRKELDNVVAIIKRFDPKAFYSVKDLQRAAEGINPAPKNRGIIPAPLLEIGQVTKALGELYGQPSATPLPQVSAEQSAIKQ